MKTSELSGRPLAFAVALIEDPRQPCQWYLDWVDDTYYDDGVSFRPDISWSQGGPIIEREKIDVQVSCVTGWAAYINNDELTADLYQGLGPTPLVAAMRCYVASKLGDEVEIPSELQP